MALHLVGRARYARLPAAGDERSKTFENPVVPEPPDALRLALDGLELSVMGRCWQVEVFTVAEFSSRRYVQVALHGPVEHFVTLRIALDGRSDRLVPALLAWLAHPSAAGHIVDVA